MSKYQELLTQMQASVDNIELDELAEAILEEIATAVENAVKAALSQDSMMPYYSPALHECRKAKVFDVDVAANLYAKEQGFKP